MIKNLWEKKKTGLKSESDILVGFLLSLQLTITKPILLHMLTQR